MNSKQFTILIVAAVLFLMTVLSPPYYYEDHHNSAKLSAGHHLFTKPAEVKSDAEMRRIFSVPESEPPHYFTAHKDRLRLYCEWITILLLAGGGILVTIDRTTPLKFLPAIFLLSLGLLCAFLILISS